MQFENGKLLESSDFLHKSVTGLAIVSLVLMTPFAINNFLQGRILLGIGSSAILVIMAFNAWSIHYRDRYYAGFSFIVLVPVILFFLCLSIRTQGLIGIFWCYPAIVSFYFMLPERMAWAANILLLVITAPLSWAVLDPAHSARMIASLLAVSVFTAISIRVINQQQYRLHILAITDPLTGVLNRMTLHNSLQQATEQFKRSEIPVTLITLDIDHFKKINDSHGHDAGDRVLQGLGKLLKEKCRKADQVFRLGGEEFLVLLYGTNAKGSEQVAEKLRIEITEAHLVPDGKVTVSIGAATLQPEEDWQAWMKRSDENLYNAKAGGRNQVVV